MENKTQITQNKEQDGPDKFEKFKQVEITCKFVDDFQIIKLANENNWYIADSDGDIISRVRQNKIEELATVDLYDMVGEPYNYELSYFKDGISVMKVLSEKRGKTYTSYYEISPSGYTYNATKIRGGLYSKLGVNYRYQEKPTSIVDNNPIDMLNLNFDTLDAREYLNVVYDVAQHRLMQEYHKVMSQEDSKLSTAKKQVLVSMAKNIYKQYDIFSAKFDRKKQKTKRVNKKTEQQQPE